MAVGVMMWLAPCRAVVARSGNMSALYRIALTMRSLAIALLLAAPTHAVDARVHVGATFREIVAVTPSTTQVYVEVSGTRLMVH
jgi:hypothetical protein